MLAYCSNDVSYLPYLYSLTDENKYIYHKYFQQIEMLYKLWVHSLQGIHNFQNYMTLAHTMSYKVSQDITPGVFCMQTT